MATNIQWNDGAAGQIENAKPAPGDRFDAWVTRSFDIGPKNVALGTGRIFPWIHRTDYWARVTLSKIPRSYQSLLARFIRHAERGGVFVINTGDGANRVYNAYLRPETEIELDMSERGDQEYTMTVEVINAVAADLICIYP